MSRPRFPFAEPMRPFYRGRFRHPMGVRPRMLRPNMRHPGFRHHLPPSPDFIPHPRMGLPHRAPLLRPFAGEFQIHGSIGNAPTQPFVENNHIEEQQNDSAMEHSCSEQNQETLVESANYNAPANTKRQFATSFIDYCTNVANFKRSRPDPEGPPVLVFVGNIPDGVDDQVLSLLFQCCGDLIKWKRAASRNKLPQTFGFCEFGNPEAAMRCIRLLHDFSICDKRLNVKADAKALNIMETYKESQKHVEGSNYAEKIFESPTNVESVSPSDECKTEAEHPDDAKALLAIEELLRKFKTKILRLKERMEQYRYYSKDSSAKNDTVSHNMKVMVTYEIERFRVPSQNLEDVPIEPGMKDLVSEEIGKFRNLSQNCPKHLAATLSQLEALNNPENSHKAEKENTPVDSEYNEQNQAGIESQKSPVDTTEKQRCVAPDSEAQDTTPTRSNLDNSGNQADAVDTSAHQETTEAEPAAAHASATTGQNGEEGQTIKTKNNHMETRRYFKVDKSAQEQRKQEEEEAQRQTIQQNIERQKEQRYQRRLKLWLEREERKSSERAAKKDENKDEQEDKSLLREHLIKFYEKYNDYEEDQQFYKGQEWTRRRRNRKLEEEKDKKDRRKEKEEIDKQLGKTNKRKQNDKSEYEQTKENKRRHDKHYKKTVAEGTESSENQKISSDRDSPKNRTKISDSEEISSKENIKECELKNEVRKRLLQNKLAEDIKTANHGTEKGFNLGKADVEPMQSENENYLMLSGQNLHRDVFNKSGPYASNVGPRSPHTPISKQKEVNEENSISFSTDSGKHRGNSPSENENHRKENGSDMLTSVHLPKSKWEKSRWQPEQHENVEIENVINKAGHLECTKDRNYLLNKLLTGKNEEKRKKKRENQNQNEINRSLIAEIPHNKHSLFSYQLRWDLVDQSLLERRVVGWLRRKLKEYTGKQNDMLINYVCSKLLLHSTPDVFINLLSDELFEKAETFVVKLWKLMIYEVKFKELCMSNKNKPEHGL